MREVQAPPPHCRSHDGDRGGEGVDERPLEATGEGQSPECGESSGLAQVGLLSRFSVERLKIYLINKVPLFAEGKHLGQRTFIRLGTFGHINGVEAPATERGRGMD